MSDKIPDDQSNSTDSQKEVRNKDISIEDLHNKKLHGEESSIIQSSCDDAYNTISKETVSNNPSTNPNEAKQKKSSTAFENTIQESLLLGIQESLEALFDMGLANTSTQQAPYQKIPNVTVFEGGKNDKEKNDLVNTDEIENEFVECELKKNDSSQDLKEDISTESTQDKPSLLEIVKDVESQDSDPQHPQQPLSIDSSLHDLQEQIQNMLQDPSTRKDQNFDLPNIDLSHLGIDNVEVRVINAGELDDISQIHDLLGQIYDDSSLTDETSTLEVNKPSFEVFTQDDVLSFEDHKGFISQERQENQENIETQKIASVPDGTISVDRNDHQKIYYGLTPKNYRIFCEVGTLSVLLYERPEYRDVHDDFDLIESTLVTLVAGQSIDVEHVHITVVGHDERASKGRYFQI